MTLPHDFVIEGTMDPSENRFHGYLPRGVGWYKRNVTAEAIRTGGTALLHFEGAYRDTSVFIDGDLALHHRSGYTGFVVPLTQPVSEVTVRCNASLGEGWFYEGGGLYRPVHLVQTPNKLRLVHQVWWVRGLG